PGRGREEDRGVASGGRWTELAAFLAAALVLAAPWWLLQWHVLGHPFGFAWQRLGDYPARSAWGTLVITKRGATFYLALLAGSPVVLAGLGVTVFRWLALARRGAGASSEDRARAFASLFVLLVLVAAHAFSAGKEGRHILLV